MYKYIFTFEGYRQSKIRLRNRKKREEDSKRMVEEPKPLEGEPVNPDTTVTIGIS